MAFNNGGIDNGHNKIIYLNHYNERLYFETMASGSDENFIEDGKSDLEQNRVVRLVTKAQVFSPVVNLIPFF